MDRLTVLAQRLVPIREQSAIIAEHINQLTPDSQDYIGFESLDLNSQADLRIRDSLERQPLAESRKLWYNLVLSMFNDLSTEQRSMSEQLTQWKAMQIGLCDDTNPVDIETISIWYRNLTKIALDLKYTVDHFNVNLISYTVPNETYKVTIPILQENLGTLVTSIAIESLVIEKQPQVIKTGAIVKSQLRLLIGPNLGLVHSAVTAAIVNEQCANRIKNGQQLDQSIEQSNSGNFVGDTCFILHNIDSNCLLANFDAMKLTSIQRCKKNGRKVTEEKFAIAFQTTIKIAGYCLNIVVRIIS